MEKLYLYLSMYEVLSIRKEEDESIATFLSLANPFDLKEQNTISTKFIFDYDEYFSHHPKNLEHSYEFILSFLKSLPCKDLLTSFMEYPMQEWQKRQQMIDN